MSVKSKFSRRQVVAALLDMLESGIPVSQVAQTLAAYLAETRQTRNVELYLRDIELAIARRFGKVAAYVSSAKQLSVETKKQVEHLVKSATGAQEVETIETINPKLIGGIVVKTADAELDGSVRTKLRNLRSI